MITSDTSDKKKEITEKTWQYLLKTGLTSSSVGELCREMQLAQSSLYHFFENKYDIWISAGKYGLSKIVDALFTYTFNHTENINEYFETFLDEVDKYKEELRLAIQITTSPVFGQLMRQKSRTFRVFYERYAERIINDFKCSKLEANVFIYTIIAIVMDYVIWDDKDIAQMLLDNLHKRVVKNLENN
ncbi:MAG: TetR/AcrR family transcriptional regulator [Ruminococcaceae bacterium]|nr:TetR/AcrR family transcriptional regulator [Oscillospiraceae bacterium]